VPSADLCFPGDRSPLRFDLHPGTPARKAGKARPFSFLQGRPGRYRAMLRRKALTRDSKAPALAAAASKDLLVERDWAGSRRHVAQAGDSGDFRPSWRATMTSGTVSCPLRPAAHGAEGANLRGRLVAGARDRQVAALLEGRPRACAALRSWLPEAGIVGRAHVREAGPGAPRWGR